MTAAQTGTRVTGAGRWLAPALVAFLLLAWAATVYMAVLVADGLSKTNSHIDWWAHAIALGLVVLSVEPVRRWLSPRIDDLVNGHLDDGYTVMTQLSRHIDSAAPAPMDRADPTLAATIARALNVPYVSIVDGTREMSVLGTRPDDRILSEVVVSYRGSSVGQLCVAPRHPRTRLSSRDESLLADLAPQLGVAIYALRVSEQLQASRAALVTAREEERRRIRRDLHDGLGPTLASVKLQLTAATRVLDDDPLRAAALLDEVRDTVDETTADVRRLVYDLRPPLIDELGLVAALRNHPSARSGLEVTVRADELPDLPAAVEVALYRIASEAIHNAVRHSGGTRCEVTIGIEDDEVHMAVTDDGRGLPDPLIAGVGITAIRERAAELAGRVELGGPPGTTVSTIVPLRAATAP